MASEIFKIDGWNNFCRIFELPEKFSEQFCFGGGIPTNFTMVDWFCPVSDIPQPACSKEVWKEKVGEIKTVEKTTEELREDLLDFLTRKIYIKDGRKYLFISNFGATFLFSKEDKGHS